jgi:hypothetical protein
MEISNSHPEATLKFRVHRIRRTVYLRSLILFLLTLLGTFLSLGILIWQWQQTITNFGPAALLRWIAIPFWATVLFSLLTVISFTMLRRKRRRDLQVSNMGLTIQKGKVLESITWDEVVHVHTVLERFGILGITWGNKAEIQLMNSDGRKFKFNQSYERIDELIEEVKHFVYPRMFEKYRLAFNRGEPISFGPLILTSDGILNGRKALRWKDLKAIKMESGALKLRPFENSEGPRFSIPAHKVPNIDLCIQLINHLSPQT